MKIGISKQTFNLNWKLLISDKLTLRNAVLQCEVSQDKHTFSVLLSIRNGLASCISSECRNFNFIPEIAEESTTVCVCPIILNLGRFAVGWWYNLN